jgi:predicted metal-dependent hydrolase
VQVIRSPKRTRTISARIRDGVLVVNIPARFSQREERDWVNRMMERVLRARRKASKHRDENLTARADALNRKYFGGKLSVTGIVYVDNQSTLHGSCTPSTGLIRISRKLAALPRWVEDYVIVHELAHLIHANHGQRFWEAVARYPLAERARGYLMALGYEPDAAGPAEA